MENWKSKYLGGGEINLIYPNKKMKIGQQIKGE